ncbi:MAG: cysteine desulfurase, partial [Alphaproteobacteria bacterium]|nr:cysteine desulfurase [Alphaproteobacteria bacterium]
TARTGVARFIGAKDNEIIFTRNATEAINLVAQSWGGKFLKDGDEIILSEMEHHANIVPWQLLKESIKIEIKVIPVLENGALDLAAYKKLLSPRTRLVAVTHISNSLGTVNLVNEIVEIAKNHSPDVRVLLDGSQGIVHRVINFKNLDCDFYVFTGHKLYGPTGIGVLAAKYEILETMPPYQGGGDMIERVTFAKTTFRQPPARFEAGTPAILEVIGLGAAIDYVQGIGMENIHAHEEALLSFATTELQKIKGLKIYGTAPEKAGIISFTMEGAHPSDIGMVLDKTGVAVRTGHHCCMPLMERLGVDSMARMSLGLYSNKDDIIQLVEGLHKVKSLFT